MALTVTEPWITRPHDITEEPVEAIYIGSDPALADLFKFKLEMDGYRVTPAPTGTDALAQARKRIPDIVFLDLGPADPSSLQMLRTLRSDHYLKDIPIVLLWRGDTDERTIANLHLGAKDFLVKANGTRSDLAWADLSAIRPLFRYAD